MEKPFFPSSTKAPLFLILMVLVLIGERLGKLHESWLRSMASASRRSGGRYSERYSEVASVYRALEGSANESGVLTRGDRAAGACTANGRYGKQREITLFV